MIDVCDIYWRAIGRTEVRVKLIEIARIIPQSVRRGIAHRTQVRQKFLDRRFHSLGHSEALAFTASICHSEESACADEQESIFVSPPRPAHGLPDTPTSSGVASFCSD